MTSIERHCYRDNFIERLCIKLVTHRIAIALGKKPQLTDYSGFVQISKQIPLGRSSQDQQAVVSKVLRSFVPAPILLLIRTLFSPTQWVCELNAWFATRFFQWLVGPCEVKNVEVQDQQGLPRQQNSGVHISKCRYLESSGCVGLCVNLCKLPTQAFFTQDFGIPLTMIPNFDDLSCEMIFGQVPPPLEQDPVHGQPCLKTQCNTAEVQALACPQIKQ
jgi:hypothetical protein